MAQQKMRCALQRTSSYIQKGAVGEDSVLSGESLSSKGYKASSVVQNNSDHRCAVLTFFVLEPNGRWRVVGLPLQCPEHTINSGSRSLENMDGVHLVCPSPFSSLEGDQQKAQRGLSRGSSRSLKSVTAKSFSGSNFQRHSRNKGFTNKVSNRERLPDNSSQNLIIGSKSTILLPGGSNATHSSDMCVNASKEDKSVKRNSRKKARKKGKRNKKSSVGTCSTVLEGIHGSSSSDTAANKDVDYRVGPLPYPTLSAVSLEHSCTPNHFGGKGSDPLCSSNTCMSGIDEVVPTMPLNSSGENLLDSENGVQTRDPGYSILNEVEDRRCKPFKSFDDPDSCILSETNDSLELDTLSIGSNSEESNNAECDFKPPNKEIAESDLSGSAGYIASKVLSSHDNISRVVANTYTHVEGTDCYMQDCTGDDRNSEAMGKKSKEIRKASGNSSCFEISGPGNLRGRFLKENNHSVWQKVRRKESDECNYELKKLYSVCSQFDLGLTDCNVGDCNMLSKYENKNETKIKLPRKLKRKASPGSKQECNSYSRKEYHVIKSPSTVCTKINMQRDEMLDSPAKLSGQQGADTISRSHSKTGYTEMGFESGRVDSIISGPDECTQICSSELGSSESDHTAVAVLNNQDAEIETISLLRSCDLVDQPALIEELPANCFPLADEEGAKVDYAVSSVDVNKQDTSSLSVLQKCVPVQVEDSGLPSSGQPDCLLIKNFDEPVAESWTLENISEEKLASDPHSPVASTNVKAISTSQNSEHVNVPLEDEAQIQELHNQSTHTPEENCNNHFAAKGLIHKSKQKNVSAFEIDSIGKLVWAIRDAYRAQLASEAIEVATGCPIADFESLLHSASPVICPSQSIVNCPTCSHERLVGVSLCKHETPNISLKSLWQWYERHGNYGLEVIAEDRQNSKRLGIDSFAFRAYFVPSLSAIQLFRECKAYSMNDGTGIPGTEIMEGCEIDEASERFSNISHLPIFSLLVPQPQTKDSSLLPSGNHVFYSESSSACFKDNSSMQPVDSAHSDDLELVFEYFEFEQPQQRRPLFEMIKELVRGDGPSQSRAYGDPTVLDSLDLHDLHPKSWYSVAWYPIYRIPDGNFRAAFLTYHSFGHLVHRSSSFDSCCVDASVISPVVGLQSYNAQGECWFQPKLPAQGQAPEILNLNVSRVLKDRLRTLEQTASLMARGSVTKGDQTYVNNQPDYEFFLSRRRY